MSDKEKNKRIDVLQNKLRKIGDYDKIVESIIPLVKLAEEMAAKADIDNGEDKKTWRMIYADVLTIQRVVKDGYSDVADEIHDMKSEDYIGDM